MWSSLEKILIDSLLPLLKVLAILVILIQSQLGYSISYYCYVTLWHTRVTFII